MLRRYMAVTALFIGLGSVGAVQAQSDVTTSVLHDFKIVTVADGLQVPWSMAWLRRVSICNSSASVGSRLILSCNPITSTRNME